MPAFTLLSVERGALPYALEVTLNAGLLLGCGASAVAQRVIRQRLEVMPVRRPSTAAPVALETPLALLQNAQEQSPPSHHAGALTLPEKMVGLVGFGSSLLTDAHLAAIGLQTAAQHLLR